MTLSGKIARTTLVLTLVPLLLLSVLSFNSFSNSVENQAIEHLKAFKEIQKQRLTDTFAFHLDRANLIASRTKLRQVLAEFNTPLDHTDTQQKILSRILQDAMASVDGILQIQLRNNAGVVVVTVDGRNDITALDEQFEQNIAHRDSTFEVVLDSLGAPEILIRLPLTLNQYAIGVMILRLSADSFLSIFNDYTGLGSSGEAILARRTVNGDFLFLHALRFDPHAALSRVVESSATDVPITRAFGTTDVVLNQALDYRGVPVIAIASPVSELGWGMVVKKDRNEVFAESEIQLRLYGVWLLVTIICIIVASVFSAKRLTQRLRQLALLAGEISNGKFDRRLEVRCEDEIDTFAVAFNQMLNAIQAFNNRLEELVKVRTADLEKARIEAELANQAKSEFLATMSHEIRTPMNAVLGFADVLGYSKLSAEQRDTLQNLQTAGKLMLSLINDILDYTKIESGRLELERTPFQLNLIVYECAELARKQADEKGLEIIIDYPSDMHNGYYGDPFRLQQILINLLTNAIKFTDKGHIILRVRCNVPEVKSNGSDRVVIEVEDTGIGINPESQAKLFEKFTQADTSTTRKFGGSGLGLAITKQLIELMEGTISVSSQVDKGSVFTVTLALEQAIGVKFEELRLHNFKAEELSNLVVLVVDDNVTNCLVLKKQLAHYGIYTVEFHSALSALELLNAPSLNAPSIDLIITDYNMPNLDGVGFLREIRKNSVYCHLPVIVLGSSDDPQDAFLIRTSGANAYFLKPLEASVLAELIYQISISRKQEFITRATLYSESVVDVAADPLDHLTGRLLIVDDILLNRMVVEGLLQFSKFELLFAESGSEAIEIWNREHIDLIFMDLHMPGMDGYTATRRIRELESDTRIPIIALTADVLDNNDEKVVSSGFDGYLTKPVTRDALVDVLRNWL